MQLGPASVEKAFDMLSDPIRFAAALFAVVSVGLLMALIRAKDMARHREALLAEQHKSDMAFATATHANDVRALHEAELRRALRVEALLSGVSLLLQAGDIVALPGKRKTRRAVTNPGLLETAPDADDAPGKVSGDE